MRVRLDDGETLEGEPEGLEAALRRRFPRATLPPAPDLLGVLEALRGAGTALHLQVELDATLVAAYTAARYTVELDEGSLALQLGAPVPALDALGAWALLTADNPFSQPGLSPALNERRRRALYAALPAAARWLPARAAAADGAWREEGLCVGLPREAALELGRRFGQNAILVGGPGLPVELVPCFPSLRGAPSRAR